MLLPVGGNVNGKLGKTPSPVVNDATVPQQTDVIDVYSTWPPMMMMLLEYLMIQSYMMSINPS